MKDFIKLFAYLIVFLLIAIVFHLNKKQIIEEARLEKEHLLKEREKIVYDVNQKEKLKDYLERKFKKLLYPGYTLLILTFLLISSMFTSLLCSDFDTEKMLFGGAVTEILLMGITLFICQKTYEFKYFLNQFAPFLRKKVFGININIYSEIEFSYNRIKDIDIRIKELDKIILV